MKYLLLCAALIFSTGAIAQDAPKVGTKPLVQIKPKGPVGCKQVGTVKGTKLWAGDCVASAPVTSDTPTETTGSALTSEDKK
jgi:hypothetical protein